MWYRKFILGIAFMGSVAYCNAQAGAVEVDKDSLIDLLQNFRAEHGINPAATKMVSLGSKSVEKKTGRRVRTRGFRVQIYSGASRSEATSVQSRFQTSYSDIGSYLTYDEPNYRVKVGDFRSRTEASNFMRELRNQYNNVFVFTEDIWTYE